MSQQDASQGGPWQGGNVESEFKTPQSPPGIVKLGLPPGIAMGRGRGVLGRDHVQTPEQWDEEDSYDRNNQKRRDRSHSGSRQGSSSDRNRGHRSQSGDRHQDADHGHRERSKERKDSDKDHPRRPSHDRNHGRGSTSQERRENSHSNQNYGNQGHQSYNNQQDAYNWGNGQTSPHGSYGQKSPHGGGQGGGHSPWTPTPRPHHGGHGGQQYSSTPNNQYPSPQGHRFRGQNQMSPQGQWPRGQNQMSPQGQWHSPQTPDGYYDHQGSMNYSNQSSDGQYTPNQRWNNRRRDEDSDVFLSKTLSSILRHNAERFGFTLQKGGFLYVDDILHKMQKLRGYKVEDVLRVVSSNDKKRFTIEQEGARYKVRANQGHSLQVDDLDLTPITSADDIPYVIHGTYYQSWELIKKTGLRRMKRNHIHFAAGEPGENEVISGMRTSCEVTIYINLDKALKDGLQFFRSANNVILCPGNEDGVLYPCYFLGARDRRKGFRLEFDDKICPSSGKTEEDSNKKRKKKNKKNKESKDEDAPHDDSTTTDDSPSPKKLCDTPSPQKGAYGMDSDKASKLAEPEAVKLDWNVTPKLVKDAAESVTIMEELISKSPGHVTVVCCGEGLGGPGSSVSMLVVLARPEVYLYHLHKDNKALVKDGKLDELLKSKLIMKVFHNISDVSRALIREFNILLNGSPLWDIQMLYEKAVPPTMDMEALEEEFNFKPSVMRKWAEQNEKFGKQLADLDVNKEVVQQLIDRGKLIDRLFLLCFSKITDELKKKLKAETYKVAIPKDDKDGDLIEKVQQLQLEMKQSGKQKKQPKDDQTQQTDNQSKKTDDTSAQNQSGRQQQKLKSAKGKNKKKR